MSRRPVVIYGASGFSGRLIAEFLREYNTPFVAAGRSASRINDVMYHVPGIETADFEIVETVGSVDVAATEKRFEEQIRPLPKAEREKKLAEMANAVQAGTPPRENAREQRTIDVVVGRGSTDYAQWVFGTCCYRQTGLLQAFAVHHLAHAAPRKYGFASPAEAFGHHEILRVLEEHGLSKARLSS